MNLAGGPSSHRTPHTIKLQCMIAMDDDADGRGPFAGWYQTSPVQSSTAYTRRSASANACAAAPSRYRKDLQWPSIAPRCSSSQTRKRLWFQRTIGPSAEQDGPQRCRSSACTHLLARKFSPLSHLLRASRRSQSAASGNRLLLYGALIPNPVMHPQVQLYRLRPIQHSAMDTASPHRRVSNGCVDQPFR